MPGLFPKVFARSGNTPTAEPRPEPALVVGQGDLAIDTVAELVRTLGQFPLDQEHMDAATFTAVCEQWAQHVTLATPVPGAAGQAVLGDAREARRDWAGVREFVRAYCKHGVGHTRAVMGDLRQVVWVFIQNLSHAFAEAEQADARVREQLGRLERLAQGQETGALKKEVLATVVTLSETLSHRRKQEQARMEALGARVRTLGEELELARRESEIDPLTKLYNRKAFDDYVARSSELHRAFGHQAALLLVDVDHFKAVNDRFGHTTGDEVLKKIADAVARLFLRKNDFVARYGGDELAVVLRETPVDAAAALAERLLRGVASIELERGGQRVPISVTIGVAPVVGDDDVKRWIDRADRALYSAKQDGRARVAVERA